MATDKLFYSIGQVAGYTGLPQSVLRYWETVFPRLCPKKTSGGTRQYSDADVSVIQTIKKLLYEQGYTIKGANAFMNQSGVKLESPGFLKLPGPVGATEVKNREAIKTKDKETTIAFRDHSNYIITRLRDIINILEE
jgi:DNA-binding transcriptional MerR regulator